MTTIKDCRTGRTGARHRNVEDALRLDALVDGVLAGLPIEGEDVPRRMRELLDVVNLLAAYNPNPLNAAVED